MALATADVRPVGLPPPVDRRSRRWRRIAPTLLGVIAILAAIQVLVSLTNTISPLDVWNVITGAEDVPRLHELAVNARLPRMLVGVMAGVALAASGALLQAITRNPLADPGLTGVTPGAVAAAVAWTAFGPIVPGGLGVWIVPIVATVGGLAAAIVVYSISRRAGAVESSRLIFVGVLVGGVLSSVTTVALLFVADQQLQSIYGWLVGTLAVVTWSDLAVVVVYVIPGMVLLVPAVGRANTLQLGDDVAVSLGQRRELDRLVVVTAAVALTAGVVVVAGGVGFVGLMAPHLVRGLVGSDLRRLVPASMLAGGAMVLAADFVARMFDPRWLPWESVNGAHLPAGVFLTLFGAAFLLSLLRKRSI